MGRQALGESKLFVCHNCYAVCKRAVVALNKKPCPKCKTENAFSLDKLKTKEQMDIADIGKVKIPKSFRAGTYEFKNFDAARPKVGDKILFFSLVSGDLFLTSWTKTNEENFEIHKGNLWLGPIVNPCSVV